MRSTILGTHLVANGLILGICIHIIFTYIYIHDVDVCLNIPRPSDQHWNLIFSN